MEAGTIKPDYTVTIKSDFITGPFKLVFYKC